MKTTVKHLFNFKKTNKILLTVVTTGPVKYKFDKLLQNCDILQIQCVETIGSEELMKEFNNTKRLWQYLTTSIILIDTLQKTISLERIINFFKKAKIKFTNLIVVNNQKDCIINENTASEIDYTFINTSPDIYFQIRDWQYNFKSFLYVKTKFSQDILNKLINGFPN